MEDTLTTTELICEPAPAAERLHFWHMLVNPAATLASLAETPRVLLPMLVTAVYATLVNYYVIQRIGLQRLLASAIQATASVDTDTLIANALAHRTQIVTMQAVSGFAGSMVTTLALGVLFWLLVTVAGGEISFRKTMAVVAHVAFFIAAVRETMIVLVVTMSRDLGAFNLKNPVGTNLAFFIHNASPLATKLMFSFDVLTVVSLVLTVIGLRRVAKDVSPAAAACVVVAPWALYVAAGAWLPWLG